MEQYRNLNSVMESGHHLKKVTSLKSLTSKGFFLFFLFLLPYIGALGQPRPLDRYSMNKYEKWVNSYNKGVELYREKKYDQAIKELTKATKLPTPDDVNHAWNRLGHCYADINKTDEAINSFKTFLSQAAQKGSCLACVNYNKQYYCMSKYDFFFVHYNLGRNYSKKGEDNLAIEYYSTAISAKEMFGTEIKTEANQGWALRLRGDLFLKQEKVKEAISDYKKAINDKDFLTEEKEKLSKWIIDHYVSNNNYTELYDFIRPLQNKNAELYNLLAFASFKINKFEEADRYYNVALKLQPSLLIDVAARDASKQFVVELQEKERQEKEEQKRMTELRRQAEERQQMEAESRRVAAIKSAEVGDKLRYSEVWEYKEGFWIVRSGTYNMYVTCFIERIEGERYQLRIGDVSSSNSQRYSTPTINGVRVSKGDVIWARPLNDPKWVYGE